MTFYLKLITAFLFLASSFLSNTAMARPEYSLVTKVDCSACHSQPFGGGQRNQFMGKAYGLRSWQPGFIPLLPVSADVRLLLNGMVDKESAGAATINLNKGLRQGALMSTIIAGNYDLLTTENSKLSIAASYDLGVFIPGPRDLYLTYGPKTLGAVPTLIAGRFRIPFGLLTDEHRSMARQLTKTTNRDFAQGIALKAKAGADFNYSLALFDSIPNYEAADSVNLELGVATDIKWQPIAQPLFLGASYLDYQVKENSIGNLSASSLYLGIDLQNITNGFLPGTLLLERFEARGFSDSNANEFIQRNYVPVGLTSELDDIRQATSKGYLAQLKFAVHPKVNLVYKYDYADIGEGSTAYSRAGYGLDIAVYHLNIIIRYDKGLSKGPEFSPSSSTVGKTVATEDMFYVVVHGWI